MFEIAFSELMVVAVVALVIIGPERLPKVARTAGHLWGRMQRYVHNVKNEISNDMALEEAKQMGGSIRKEISSVEQELQKARIELEQKILDAQTGKTSDAHVQNTAPATEPARKPDATS
ncbi:MAG: Sec-independent protein translocase protein TatB [Gallionella sp.]|nr:Sec-independent protein translocase protein TatB [Gallionella sp.]